MNDALYDDMQGKVKLNVEYTYVEHQLNNELIGLRTAGDQYYGHVAEVKLFSDEDVLTDHWGGVNLIN